MPLPASLDASLDRYLGEKAQRGEFAGSVLIAVDGGPSFERSYGVADRTTGTPITADTEFQIASVSKAFAAAAVLLLHERGKLSPNDDLNTWLPDTPESWQAVSIQHLMTHTSGLPHWRDVPELDLFAPTALDHLLSVFASHPLKFRPGHGWAYSSPGYHLVARVVEEASGQRYVDFLRRNVFDPLGMTGTSAGNIPRNGPKRALGYGGGAPVTPFELETANRGAGDLWSTTGDLVRWDRALSTPGRLLSEASLAAMFTRQAALPRIEAQRFPGIDDPSYGYGWYLSDVGGMDLRFHPGDNPGYRSLNARIPKAGVTLCALSNEETSDLFEIGLRLVAGFGRALSS